MLLASKCLYYETTDLDCALDLVGFIVQYGRFLPDYFFFFAINSNDL